MLARCFLALLTVVMLQVSARASILLFLDDVDDYRFVRDVVETEPVKAEGRELQRLAALVLKMDRPAIAKLLGAATPKPPKAFAMPLAEQRAIGLSGLRRTDDERPDEHFINFHPVGDFAGVEVYYGRTETASEPIAVRFYLRCDGTFERLHADNSAKRLAWEWERLLKLAKEIERDKTPETSDQ